MLKQAHSKNTYFDYDAQCWIVDGIVQRCGHPENMNCGCYGRLHEGDHETIQQVYTWHQILVDTFIEHYGKAYLGAADKWVLVSDFIAAQNPDMGLMAIENLTDEIDEKVFVKLYPEATRNA